MALFKATARAAAAALALAAAAAPGLAAAQDAGPSNRYRPAGTQFKCTGAPDVFAQFSNRDAKLVAIVDAGEGAYALPLKPWTGGEPKITWTDGQHTLTWSPGVQIMWMDGSNHRMCGRGEHKH